ncbi:EAL domain-containing protein [Arabiibacter massiliensis]|uniref:EAL domain-containing protein n=1 Tax=Arabiibacter massiliensis TaxID=1870985 RepID=UPI0009BAE772|nr:EAL domain-containing protein [Arabiibacter massiliensis]
MPATRGKEPSKSGHTYVINRDYDVVYMDRAARTVFPGGRIGEKCYVCFRGNAEPCADCTWKADQGCHAAQSVIYSARHDQWYEITCLELDWFDQGPCVLFSGCPIDEHSRGLFAALSEPSSYDELFELNLTDDAYKVLYHEPGKYAIPPLEGRLADLHDEVAAHLIHPEDRARFEELWDLTTLIERLDAAGGSLHGEFRKKLASGDWTWARQSIVPVKRGTGGEAVVMCFVSDVDQDVRERDRHAEASQIQLLRERDQLTGLYNASTFYDKAEAFTAARPDARFEALYIDIEHFKIYNEWHGREAGDAILRAIARRLERAAQRFGGIAGYLGGDDFALIVPLGTITEELVERELKKPPFDTEDTIGFQPALGVCAIAAGQSVVTACDHAMIAMNSVKASYAKQVARYRTSMAEELESEAKILLEVKQALKNREFILYFQPQCSTRTGRVVGLEALIRWQHPERGLVMPGEFIPVLERNGFIASLDLYAWDEACRHIRSWIDQGGRPIPVSVNISRADLYAIDVVDTLEELVTRYGLDRSLLELEITESAYAEDEKMAEAVNRLKELGFTILMDDFGSGYSSLNMLKSINVDIIKIDMGFLSRERDAQRGESILEAIVSMARLMDLRIIAEGAETAEQVEFLRNIGCDYAQGYYFHRPMDRESLEELLTVEGVIDYRGVLSPAIEMIDMDVLVHEDEMSRAIIDNLIGGMAVYAVHDDHFEIMQVNNEYYRVTGCNPVDLKERQTVIWKQVHPDDLPAVMELFRQAELHPVSGAEGVVRRYRLSGELMWLKMRVFFLSRQEDRRLFYAAVEDATDRQRREMASLSVVSDKGRIFELLSARSAHHWCVNLTRGAFLDADDRALLERRLGMRFQDWGRFDVRETIRSFVSPDERDAQAVEALLDPQRMLEDFENGVSSRMVEYRQRTDADAEEPGERWTELRYHLMRFPERPDVYAYLYVMDIDERKRRELSLQKRAEHDALTGLLNRDTGSARLLSLFARAAENNIAGAFVIVDLDDFKSINDRYGHLCGDSVLSGIGKHLKAAFRKGDLICRWGGDEFIVYCEDISADDIRHRVAALCGNRWHAAASGGKTVELSVSAGIAMVPENGVDFTTVYDRADTALYEAKKEGKARFRMHGV